MADKQRDTLIQIMVVLIVALVGFALFSSLFGGGMMGGMMGFGWLFMLLPVIFIVILIYALLDRDRPTYNQQPYYEYENPMRVLKRRYACGELSREEYLKIKEDINGR